MTTLLLDFKCAPGVNQDDSEYSTDIYTDGTWVRFYISKPQKIGGYQQINLGNTEIVRSLFLQSSSNNGNLDLYQGQASRLGVSTLSSAPPFSMGTLRDRTPAGYVSDPNVVWLMDVVFSSQGTGEDNTPLDEFIVAVPALIAQTVNMNTPRQVYFGSVNTNGSLQPLMNLQSDGGAIVTGSGLCVINSFIFIYGNNGFIRWNNGLGLGGWNVTTTDAIGGGATYIGTENFLYGAPIRQSQQVTGLFWSTTSVVQGVYQPASPSSGLNAYFSFSYVSTLSTCLSGRSIASSEPYFFWVGNNTFYQYNGIVTEVQNETNKEFFFRTLNQSASAKVTSFVELQYHEWWILFPNTEGTGYDPTNPSAQECNWALIYNTQYNCWFDTELSRATALRSSTLFPYPLMTSSKLFQARGSFADASYPIWAHEYGFDQIDYFGNVSPIPAYITALVSLKKLQQQGNALLLTRVILDLNQAKNTVMTFRVVKKGYPRTTALAETVYPFLDTDEFLTMSEKATIFLLTFASNAVGGAFLMGKTSLEFIVTDDLREQPTNVLDYSSL